MKYSFSAEQKQYVQALITGLPASSSKNAAQLWLDTVGDEVTDSELDALGALTGFDLKDLISWLKGGVRPGHGH